MAGLLVALLITSDQTFAFGAGGPCGPRPFVPGRAAREGGADVPERLAAEACDRIDACDGVIRAMLPEPDRRGRLRAAAAELERAWPRAGERPPLWGLLVGVKDVFHLAGFDTRAGAALPPGALLGDRPGSGDARLADAAGPLDEGTVIRRLRDAGALFVGKTVTAEFAFAEPGPTRNPLDPSRTPGGSSSGSAAAVAAGYCRAALGTQTIGSVIRPAAFCGLFALKPTYGRVPCDGLVPFSPSVDTVGWMTADATALADVAAVLCEGWATEAARPDRPLVLGVPDGPYLDQAPPDARASFEEAVGRIAAAGHDVRRVPALADVDDVNRRHRELVAAEMAEVHAAWHARWGDRYRPRTREIIERGRAVAPADVDAARYGRSDLRASLERAMDGAGLDLWLAPAASGAAPRGLDSTGDPILQLPWTHAGMPTATVPADRDADGMPIGVQLVARSGRDEDLVAWLPGLAEALAE